MAGVDWRHNSGGVRACHRLVHQLNEHGYPAYSTGSTNPEWNEKQLDPFLFHHLNGPIVIYPEVVSGNPMQAKAVVRWVLNTPGYLGGDSEYDPAELVYTWSEKFIAAPRLTVDITEHELFNTEGVGERDVDCFFVGKGPIRGAHPNGKTAGMTEITPAWPPTRAEMAALLKRTRTLYTYDDLTGLSTEALLCGCKVVVLPEGTEMVDSVTPVGAPDWEAQLEAFVADTQAAFGGTE